MKVFIAGNEASMAEINELLGEREGITYYEEEELPRPEKLREYELFIDLLLDEQPERLEAYASQKGKLIIGCAVKKSLAEMVSSLPLPLECTLAGMNLLPGFINRPKAEVSLFNKEDMPKVEGSLKNIGITLEWVEDRVGMVSPRIVFMIINEAFYTVQEGTASMEDIDKSMKLGTNYPLGPFEWCRKTGLRHVYETLEALYQDTHEERYKVCPLMKRKYLLGEK